MRTERQNDLKNFHGCTCDHDPYDHYWEGCEIEGCDCEGAWEE